MKSQNITLLKMSLHSNKPKREPLFQVRLSKKVTDSSDFYNRTASTADGSFALIFNPDTFPKRVCFLR
jgi:hypothetical protein